MSPVPDEPARAVGPMRIVMTNLPESTASDRIVRGAVEQHLAACANSIPIRSRYWWKGRIEESREVLVLFKTSPKKVGALFRYLQKRHPYEVPEIVELDVPRVARSYLDWILDAVETPGARTRTPRRPSARRRGSPRGRGAHRPGRTRGPPPRQY